MKKEDIIKELKTVYDPEMPSIDVFTLGLIYDIDIHENNKVTITHTLTSMLCPAADEITKNIKEAGERAAGALHSLSRGRALARPSSPRVSTNPFFVIILFSRVFDRRLACARSARASLNRELSNPQNR